MVASISESMENRTYGTFSKEKNALKKEVNNNEVIIDIENETFSNNDIIKEMIIRFPHLLQDVLKSLKLKTLINCFKVSKELYDFIDNNRYPWIKNIQQVGKVCKQLDSKNWNKILSEKSLKSVSMQIFVEILALTEPFFENTINNKNCWSPLHFAVENGRINFSKYLIGKTKNSNQKDENGVTPLHLAAKKGLLEISKLLIEKIKHKIPNDKNRNSPLHYAAKFGNLDVCRVIFEKIEDKNPRNLNGDTPLHFAAQNGRLNICKYFVENGVQKEQVNQMGQTPYFSLVLKSNGINPPIHPIDLSWKILIKNATLCNFLDPSNFCKDMCNLMVFFIFGSLCVITLLFLCFCVIYVITKAETLSTWGS